MANQSKHYDPEHPKHKRLKYDRVKIKEAIDAIKNKNMTIRMAAVHFKIPRSTLQDRLHGRVDEENMKIGRETVLNEKEEQVLVDWLINLSKCGFPRKRSDLVNTVEKIIKEDNRPNTFKNGKPGLKWYSLFMKRHPELSERAPEAITKARAAITEEFIKKWFKELEAYLTEIGHQDILEDPRRILNGDETSFSICPNSGKVIGPKGWKNIYDIKKGSEKETITVLLVVTASGETLPPMIVFPYVRKPPKDIVESAEPHWFIGISDSGWMKSGLFFEYIVNCVHRWREENNIPKPILLLVDGHKSHLTKDLSVFCDENGIILYALPPNTTHIMQPADVSVFRPLKNEWKKTVKHWQDMEGNSDKTLSKFTFCPLLKRALNGVTPATIKNGFQRCGLYPFDPSAVDYTKCVKNTFEALYGMDSTTDLITENELATTIKVLKACETELMDSGIELTTIEKIIQEKKDHQNAGHRNKRKCSGNGQEINVKKQKTSTALVKRSTPEIRTDSSENSENRITIKQNYGVELYIVNDEGILERSDWKMTADPNLNKQHFNLSPNQYSSDVPAKIIATKAQVHCQDTSSFHNSHVKVHNVDEEIYVESDDVSGIVEIAIPTKKDKEQFLTNVNLRPKRPAIATLCPHDRKTCGGTCKLDEITIVKDIPLAISDSLAENLDIASDFDFSLPASPSVSVKSPRVNSPSTVLSRNSSPVARHLSPLPTTPTSRNVVSPAFRKHLFAPSSLNFGSKRKPKGEKMPLAISSEKWRQFNKEKEDLKERIVNEREERKRRIEQNRQNKARQKLANAKSKVGRSRNPAGKRQKKTSTKKSTTQIEDTEDKENEFGDIVFQREEIRQKVLCAGCQEELISDVEEEELKNIGCDLCPKWYHLGCTTHRGKSYEEVSVKDFTCHQCLLHLV